MVEQCKKTMSKKERKKEEENKIIPNEIPFFLNKNTTFFAQA